MKKLKLAILASAVCYAVSAIAARVQARTNSTRQMMFWLMLLMAIGATTLAAPNWVALDPAHAWLLLGLAISGFFGQLAITEAFSHGEASVVAPFTILGFSFTCAITSKRANCFRTQVLRNACASCG